MAELEKLLDLDTMPTAMAEHVAMPAHFQIQACDTMNNGELILAGGDFTNLYIFRFLPSLGKLQLYTSFPVQEIAYDCCNLKFCQKSNVVLAGLTSSQNDLPGGAKLLIWKNDHLLRSLAAPAAQDDQGYPNDVVACFSNDGTALLYWFRTEKLLTRICLSTGEVLAQSFHQEIFSICDCGETQLLLSNAWGDFIYADRNTLQQVGATLPNDITDYPFLASKYSYSREMLATVHPYYEAHWDKEYVDHDKFGGIYFWKQAGESLTLVKRLPFSFDPLGYVDISQIFLTVPEEEHVSVLTILQKRGAAIRLCEMDHRSTIELAQFCNETQAATIGQNIEMVIIGIGRQIYRLIGR